MTQRLDLLDVQLISLIGKRHFWTKNVNEKLNIFNETILNKLEIRNFIPHETVSCDDRTPPWFTNKIKALIPKKKT